MKTRLFLRWIMKRALAFFGTCPHTQQARQRQLSAACEEIEWMEKKNCDSFYFYGQLSVRHSHLINQVCLSEPVSVCAEFDIDCARQKKKKWINCIRHAFVATSAANSVRTVRWLDRIITVKSAGQLSLRYGSMLWVTRASHSWASIGQEMQGERKVLANN